MYVHGVVRTTFSDVARSLAHARELSVLWDDAAKTAQSTTARSMAATRRRSTRSWEGDGCGRR
jgi:hypothetical protein